MATTYYHVTTVWNYPSISRLGLLTEKSQGRRRAVWVCTRGCVRWAILHTIRRHHADFYSVVILRVKVVGKPKRSGRIGLWYTTADVPPERIDLENVMTAKDWS